MIVFAPVESLQRADFRNNARWEDFRGVELRDVCHGNALLLFIHVEDGGAIRSADVGSLPVQLRGIVSHGKKDSKELPVGDLGGIVDNFERFRVTGGFGDHLPVSSGFGGTAGVARCGLEHALDALEDGLSSPKTAAGKHGRLLAGRGSERRVQLSRGDRRVGRLS
jgi:hypothetical protein